MHEAAGRLRETEARSGRETKEQAARELRGNTKGKTDLDKSAHIFAKLHRDRTTQSHAS